MELKDLTAGVIREQRPDLAVELQENKTSGEIDEMRLRLIAELRENLRSTEERQRSANERAATAERERDHARELVREAERRERKAETARRLEEALAIVDDLPEIVVKRIRDRFTESESIEGIAEAIRIERDYLRALRKDGFVRNDGGSDGDNDLHEDNGGGRMGGDSLEGIFEQLGYTKESARIAAGGRF